MSALSTADMMALVACPDCSARYADADVAVRIDCGNVVSCRECGSDNLDCAYDCDSTEWQPIDRDGRAACPSCGAMFVARLGPFVARVGHCCSRKCALQAEYAASLERGAA